MSTKFLLNTLCAPQWKSIGVKKHHGINTPLFSLRSNNSSGIGEFLDLKLLIDWLQPLGFDVIQLLPLNDLGDDTSPYNAISSNALNPIYISLEALPDIEQDEALMAQIQSLKHFNDTERVHYADIKRIKDEILYSYAQKKPLNSIKIPIISFLSKATHGLNPTPYLKP
jgi:4-alpha-glucanotransferase